jgi:hypothetical protein
MSGSVSLVDGHIDPDKKPMTFEDVKRIRENPTSEDVDNKELHRLIDEAIEKQIPKKPILDTIFPSGVEWYLCPACNHNNVEKSGCFCHKCGQAIDWSDRE